MKTEIKQRKELPILERILIGKWQENHNNVWTKEKIRALNIF